MRRLEPNPRTKTSISQNTWNLPLLESTGWVGILVANMPSDSLNHECTWSQPLCFLLRFPWFWIHLGVGFLAFSLFKKIKILKNNPSIFSTVLTSQFLSWQIFHSKSTQSHDFRATILINSSKRFLFLYFWDRRPTRPTPHKLKPTATHPRDHDDHRWIQNPTTQIWLNRICYAIPGRFDFDGFTPNF